MVANHQRNLFLSGRVSSNSMVRLNLYCKGIGYLAIMHSTALNIQLFWE